MGVSKRRGSSGTTQGTLARRNKKHTQADPSAVNKGRSSSTMRIRVECIEGGSSSTMWRPLAAGRQSGGAGGGRRGEEIRSESSQSKVGAYRLRGGAWRREGSSQREGGGFKTRTNKSRTHWGRGGTQGQVGWHGGNKNFVRAVRVGIGRGGSKSTKRRPLVAGRKHWEDGNLAEGRKQ